jgi:membrane protein
VESNEKPGATGGILRGALAAVPVAVIVATGALSLRRSGDRGRRRSRARSAGHKDLDGVSKPSNPGALHKRTWRYIARRTLHEFTADQCTDLAAALTYYMVLSIFPGLLALVSLLGIFGQARQATDALLRVVEQLAPGGSTEVIRGVIEQFTRSPAVGLALVVGIVGAIWSASGYIGAFGRALNRVYEVTEGRPFWKLRPVQLLVTVVGIIVTILVAIILVVSGPVAEAIGNVIGLGRETVFIWSVAKWPVLAAVVILMVAVLYYATPNVRQPRFRWVSPGSLLAVVILGIATVGFGFYVSNFANYDRTYGSLGGVIVFLLWLWITNLALLFGAEFDSELERGRELQGGIAAEEILRLPPRDTQAIRKAAGREAEDIAAGRKLRHSTAQRSRWRKAT